MRRALVLACLGLACDSPRRAPERVVLHVSTSFQLTDLSIGSGATAFVRDLVGTWVSQDFEVDEDRSRGAEVWLRPRAGAARSLAELCPRLSGPLLAAAPEVSGEHCVVRFPPRTRPRDEPAVDPRVWSLYVLPGPFELVRATPTQERPESQCSLRTPEDADDVPLYSTVVLEKRGPSRIDEIHVHSLSMAEQWRHLIGGRTQVASQLPILYRAWLEPMTTIYTVELETGGPIGLVFNTRSEPWSSRDARRELARALDLDAIARVACLDAACRDLGAQAFDARTDIPPPEFPAALPRQLDILVMDTDWNSTQAAMAIRHQLRRHRGIDVRIEQCPITVLHRATTSGEFGLLVMPLRRFPGEGDSFEEWMQLSTRYWNPRIEAAVRARDEHAFAALMREDVFALPLFRNLLFTAIDTGWCNARPEALSWAWMADLRPCGPGERPGDATGAAR